MTVRTFFFGTWIGGWGRAVSWGHYAMVAVCIWLSYMGVFSPECRWVQGWVLLLWLSVFLSFINAKRPWLLRSPDGDILDRVER